MTTAFPFTHCHPRRLRELPKSGAVSRTPHTQLSPHELCELQDTYRASLQTCDTDLCVAQRHQNEPLRTYKDPHEPILAFSPLLTTSIRYDCVFATMNYLLSLVALATALNSVQASHAAAAHAFLEKRATDTVTVHLDQCRGQPQHYGSGMLYGAQGTNSPPQSCKHQRSSSFPREHRRCRIARPIRRHAGPPCR